MSAKYDTTILKDAIEAAFVKAASEQSDSKASRSQVAEDIAKAVEVFIKTVISSARVSFEKGTVTGTTAVQGAPVPLTLGAASQGTIE